MRNQKAFTLVELLVVVSIIIITVGVVGDILVSIIRSYNKTQVTNEIEQNANFVMLKLEKELKNAVSVNTVDGTRLDFNLEDDAGTVHNVVYEIKESSGKGYITRNYDSLGEVILTNNFTDFGVNVDLGTSKFEWISAPGAQPAVVKIVLKFTQFGSSVRQFTGDVTLENTVVARRTY